MSFGTWLRRQREMREIGLREIAEASKISLRYLEAFEQDRPDLLPAPVFARGFLREYARYVGLNPDEVVNYFLSTHAATAGGGAPVAAAAAPRRRREWLYGSVLAGGTAALLGIVALLSYLAERRQEQLASVPPPPIVAPPPIAVPEPAPAPAEPPAPRAPLRVSLYFLEDCWVERVVDEAPRVSELRVRGETLQIEAQDNVVLTFGNAPGVRLEVNGERRPLPPPEGTVLRDFRIALADLGAGGETAPAPAPG